ncbi:MAG: flagellar basal body P-ring formation chaperone FlgA, partial [Pseudomonadota bacterium]
VRDLETVGALSDPTLAVGLEARVALYAGRPIRPGDIGPPAVVERNQIIPLVFANSVITITTEGRALDRAGPGDFIRVMNLSSRITVTARIDATGAAHVSQ